VLSEHGCMIAPRTFYAWLSRPPSKRALWDLVITEILAGIYEPDEQGRRKPESLYGATKMWAHLRRQGIEVARCTVERLMAANGWAGVRRRKKVRTTIADPAAGRAPDLVDHQFTVSAPNVLLVADFTYVPLASGSFVYTAFAIDAYAGRIVGWECATTKTDTFVRTTITQAAALRSREGNPLWAILFTIPMPGRNIRRFGSVKPCPCPGWWHRSGQWATPSTTHWPRPPSACTRPKQSGTTHRSGTASCGACPTWRR
jgi:hypothetical protein